MSNALPVLGFDDREPTMRIEWADGTRLTYAGILAPLGPEWQAEQTRKQELRNCDVVILDDYR